MTKPTIDEINTFDVLLKGFIEDRSSTGNAIEIIEGMFDRETLKALLEEYYDGEVIFKQLIDHDELMKLLIYFCEINPNIVKISFTSAPSSSQFCILQMVLRDGIKYMDLYDWIKIHTPDLLEAQKQLEQQEISRAFDITQDLDRVGSFPQLLPTLALPTLALPTLDFPDDSMLVETTVNINPQVKILSPEEQFDERIKPFINTRLLVDNSILDAFLYQSYKDKLAAKRIALMPTIRSIEAISPEQLQAIRDGLPLSYTTGVTLESGNINPVLEDHTTSPDMVFAVWPVCVSNAHYGVFILDIRPHRDPQSTFGFYIEPLNGQLMIQLMCTSYAIQLPEPCDPVLLRQMLSSFMYESNTKQLTTALNMTAENIDYIFLSQDPSTNFCSDNVIATLDWLASDNVDLLNNPTTIQSLQNQYLSEDIVRAIRLLQIKQFGVGYLWLQLPEKLKNATTRTCLVELEKMQPEFFQKKEDVAVAPPTTKMESLSAQDTIDKQPEPAQPLSALWCSMFPAASAAASAPMDIERSNTEDKDPVSSQSKHHPLPGE